MQFVCPFDDASTELDPRIGARARSLRHLHRLGLPVPPGFAVTDIACRRFLETGDLPPELEEQLASAVATLGAAVATTHPGRPILLAVRSSPPVDMPELLDAVLALGVTEESSVALGQWASPTFAASVRRQFLESYAATVRGVPRERIAATAGERAHATADGAHIADALEALVLEESHRPVPDDLLTQLHESLETVFASWDRTAARRFRRSHGISDDLGTGAVVHLMVHGDVDDRSGAGVALSRDPAEGLPHPAGSFQLRDPSPTSAAAYRPLAELADLGDAARTTLADALARFEAARLDAVRLDFVCERDTMWFLEGRAAARTAAASVAIAVDLVDEGVIDTAAALRMVEADRLTEMLHPQLVPGLDIDPIAGGTAASPGAVTGVAVFDSDEAVIRAARGESVILIRRETTPEDLPAMTSAAGILTSHGGRTSHAAVAARGLATPAVTGAAALHLDLDEGTMTATSVTVATGDPLTIDANTGLVYAGRLETVAPTSRAALDRILEWADDARTMQVWANVDSPEGAALARADGAEGIGLARTEYMFSGDRLGVVQRILLAESEKERADVLEDLEELQTSDFERLLEAMDGMPVVVRLLDPPLHEFLPDRAVVEHDLAAAGDDVATAAELRRLEAALDEWEEANPMLGLRGVRLAVVIPEIYRTQVLAALEAVRRRLDQGGDPRLHLMIPLVSTLDELHMIRDMIEEEVHFAGRQLEVGIGTMIELPRAALIAPRIAMESDFFSFGTNDLTQTTMGLSRDDAEEAFLGLYLEQGILLHNPFQTIDRQGVGRLIEIAIREGRAANPGLVIGVCGEHGGDPRSIAFFNGVGVDYVSCSPPRLPVARLAAAQAVLSDVQR